MLRDIGVTRRALGIGRPDNGGVGAAVLAMARGARRHLVGLRASLVQRLVMALDARLIEGYVPGSNTTVIASSRPTSCSRSAAAPGVENRGGSAWHCRSTDNPGDFAGRGVSAGGSFVEQQPGDITERHHRRDQRQPPFGPRQRVAPRKVVERHSQ
jgi:hypothetical protein